MGRAAGVGDLLAGSELRGGCAGSAGSGDSLAGWEQKGQHGGGRAIISAGQEICFPRSI